jgi:hypothetical protein
VVGPLAQARQRAGVGGAPELRLIGLRQARGLRADALPPRGEHVHQRLAHAGDLPAVAVAARHPADAEPPGERVLRGDRGDGGGGRAVPVQRHRVQRPPFPVGLPADLVQDQVVDVQLRVAVPAGVLPEGGDHPLAGIFPPAAGVVSGAGLAGLALEVVQRGGVALHDRVPDVLGDGLPLLAGVRLAALRCGGRVGQGAGVEQRDGLGDAERRVPVKVWSPDLSLRLGHQLGTSLGRGLGLGGQHGLVDLIGGAEAAGCPAQAGLASGVAGIEMLAVEGLEDRAVDRGAGA